jgi:RHS repeat-associated protein
LHSAGQVYLRARWYAPGQGRFVSEDPFAGWAEMPYSLHPYQYTYSNPVRWTDPTGECVGWLWGDPTCQFIGRDRILRGDLEWEEARPWAGAGLDVAPVTGDIKGFLEVFTGCDLVTGEDLGAWRWAGLVPFAGPRLRKLRMVRHLHDVDVVVDLGRHGDDLVLPPGARASGGRGSGGTRSSDIPWSTPTVRRAARELGEGATNVWVASRTEAEELFLRTFVGENPPYRNSTGMTSTEANRFFDGRARTYHWDDQVDAEGRLLGHPQNDPNAQYRHLQVHTDREVIVISYGPPLVWP